MNASDESVNDGELVLADCANFGQVLWSPPDDPKRTVAVKFNSNFIEHQEHSDGYRFKRLAVYDFGEPKGSGCEQCLYKGQIAEYEHSYHTPYYSLITCPHCSLDETD